MENESAQKLLRRVSIFSHVDSEKLAALATLVDRRSFTKGMVIVGQEEPGDALFIILSGQVKVVLYGESGREITLTSFKEGDFFGEMSLLDGMPRSANVIATEDSALLVLKREAFRRHLEQAPTTAIEMLAELSRRLRKADEVIGNLALLDVYGRVARVLINLAETEGEKTLDGIVISKRPTQQDMANMVGTSRETVSRALNEFQKRGLLSMDGKKVLLRPQFYTDRD